VNDTQMTLAGNTDAQVWATEFLKVIVDQSVTIDEGLMLGWFANAIMSGYDEGVRAERKRGFDDCVREIAFQAAGAGAWAVMHEAPHVVMPDQAVTEGVDAILAEFGVKGHKSGSSCCGAEMRLETGVDGMDYGVCSACGRPADGNA
jgi:hypothetical protein